MGKSITDFSSVTRVGLDLAKRVFQVHAIDAAGAVVVAKAVRRSKLLEFFSALPRCIVSMEACSTAHHWGRALIGLGFDVRLIPPAHVTALRGSHSKAPGFAGGYLLRRFPRFLDDPRSRPEFYILTERSSDPLNGFLSISSPLAIALTDASPGDEISIHIGDRERTVLYMNLERESRQAA